MLNEQTINRHVTIGGRPEAADIEDLRKRGFGTIINLMTPDEPGYAEEERLVENSGLSYASIPVAPNLVDDMAVARFNQEIASSPKPVAVHCKGGGRAGVMTLLYLAIQHGWTVAHALEEGEKLGLKIGPDSPYRGFVEGYIKRHSAGERVDDLPVARL